MTANIDQVSRAAMIFDRVYGRIEDMARSISKMKTKVLIEGSFLPTAVFAHFGNKTRLDFRDSELQYANFEYAELAKSSFYMCKLDSTNFTHAILRGADFFGGSLDGADLKWADLSGAKLLGCSLRGADLEDTKLVRAELDGVDVLNAKFGWLNRDALRKCKWWESETSELVLQDLYDEYQINPKAFTYQLPEDFSIDKRISEERWGEGPPRFQ